MRICVIFNPKARGGKAKRLRRYLEERRAQCEFKPTLAPGAGRPLAAEAVREGFDTIVAAGGDGTVNEVLNGIGDEPDGLTRARLAVLPVGTVNVFARELGLPLRMEAAWETILRGREKAIDLGKMEFVSNGQPESRYFLQMAGAGLDARAVELVSWRLKRQIGQFAYMVAGLKALSEKPARVIVKNGLETIEGELAVIGNGRFYGGEISVFHHASLCDGLLDVCVFPKVNFFVLVRYAWAYVTRSRFQHYGERYFQTKAFEIESNTRAPFELEGENVGQLPARCSVRPGALRVISL